MKQFLITALALFVTLSIYGQDETKSLSGFNELSASTSVEIELIKSNANKAEIDIVRGDREELKIDESGDRLSIYWKNKSSLNWNNSNNNRKAKNQVVLHINR